MATWLSNPKRNMIVATGVLCLGGSLLLDVAPSWLAFGSAGLAAGLISLLALKKDKRTFWRVAGLLAGESVGVGLVAQLAYKLLQQS